MGAHSLLQRRKYSYFIRQRVPADLVAILGKREIVRSLGTLNLNEAKRLVRSVANEIDRVFEEARKQVDLPADQVAQLANHWLVQALAEDAEAREEGEMTIRPDTQEMGEWSVAAARDQLGLMDPATVESEADEVLEGAGILNAAPPTRRRLTMALLRASVVLQERVEERNRGVWREDSGGVIESPAPASGRPVIRPRTTGAATSDNLLLSEAFDRWAAERKPPVRTLSEFRTFMRRFQEVFGEDPPIRNIKRAHVREFKDVLLRLPARPAGELAKLPAPVVVERVGDDPAIPRLSPGAINKALGAISAVLSWAQRNDYVEANAASGIKVEDNTADAEKRLPYDADDLTLIFGSKVFQDAPADPTKRTEDYWLPFLALYTGARLEELGQALVSDVREEAGHPYLDINTVDEGKRVKNKGSRRKVPLHPELIRAGFLGYVEALRAAGQSQLFPDLKRDPRGSMTAQWSKWWGRYARDKLGITDRRKVFHSFRHTFKDACRRARIPEPLHDALTGHSSPSVGRRYGSGEPVEVLAEAVAKISYPGVVGLRMPNSP